MNTRLRFSISDDLCLLREVLILNPFEDSKRWEELSKTVVDVTGKNFSVRSVKDHLVHLLKLWKKEDKANIRKSGTKEEYVEKEQLLQKINDMARDFNNQKKRLSGKESRQHGTDAREAAIGKTDSVESAIIFNYEEEDFSNEVFETVQIPDSISKPGPSNQTEKVSHNAPQLNTTSNETRKRKAGDLSKEYLLLLESKEKNHKEWREKQLQLEEQKIALIRRKMEIEEEKIRIEKEERLAKIESDREERQHRIELEKRQQNLFEKLVNMLERK